jgi:serine/threonine protein kinase/tetratricopeptide (TPR) repeat protein
MSPASLSEEEVFQMARRIDSPDARRAYLDQACRDDATLRNQVESLLAAFEASESFLETPATAIASEIQNRDQTVTEHPGAIIGPYKLLQQIGEGGMGVVFMAEQTEPIQRTVALKIIKAGMDTRQVIARFEAERQALAMMDHPNIAKVLDAGTTDTGRPYFVMDLVKGVPITKYCDEKQLSLRERLELFIQVCQAVQHAHQKGIIHRDIKPTNVIVAEYDNHAVPKVIDFGVAKATAQKLTERTVFTEFGQVIGTVEYMSPEQAKLNQLDIDTRSDIYSLGVLLYELLTGTTPFERKRLQEAAFDEMLRIIREEEPLTPSTKLSSSDTLPSIAANRHTEPARLTKEISGDLDWIVMKALEKDRNRRYETANELARDIERHRDNEPVVARPPTAGYRLQKLVRRNKLVVLAGSAVVVSLIAGFTISTFSLVREKAAHKRAVAAEQAQIELRQQAEAEKKNAQAEAARSTQVAQFLKDMLRGVGPGVARGRDTALLREILNQTALRLSLDLAGQPELEADLRGTLGVVYRELGDYPSAAAMHREELALWKKSYGNEHAEVAAALDDLGEVLHRQGQLREAEQAHREALAIQKKVFGAEHVVVALTLTHLGSVIRRQARPDEAESLLREALAMRQKLLGNKHPDVAHSLSNLSLLLISPQLNKGAEAEPLIREAMAIQKERPGSDEFSFATPMLILARALALQGRSSEAEPMYREALAMKAKLLGREHPEIARPLYDFALFLRDEGKLAEAETTVREVLAIQRKHLGHDHSEVNEDLNLLAEILLAQGRVAEAESMLRDQLAIQRTLLGNDHRAVSDALGNLARLLQDQGKLAEAEAIQREELAVEKKLSGEEHPFVANSLGSLAAVLRDQGKLTEAESVIREALAMRRKLQSTDDPDLAATLAELASVLLAEEKFVEAESPARECLAIREKKRPNDWRAFNARALLGRTLLGQKKYADAEPLLLAGYEGMKQREDTIPALGRPRLRETLQSLVQLYEATSRPEETAEWMQKLIEFDK